jgi:hypothetical protein
MTVITHNRGPSRLGDMIDKPGGISVGVALIQARANVLDLLEPGLAVIDGHIRTLLEIPPPTTVEETFERLILVYREATAVIDVAGPFELGDLCAAAANLCNIVDAAAAGQPFDWRIVTVHGQAMQMLLRLTDDAEEARRTVLDRLEVFQTRPGSPQTG